MKVERLIPILNVSNIEESFAWFEKLGWKKGWDWALPPDVRMGFALPSSCPLINWGCVPSGA